MGDDASMLRSEASEGVPVKRSILARAARAGLLAVVLSPALGSYAALDQGAFFVNPLQDGNQFLIDAASGANGDTGAIWYDAVRNQTYVRRFVGEGNSLGATSVVVPYGAWSLGFDAQGNYVIVDDVLETTNVWNVYAQVFHRDGTVAVPRFKVNGTSTPLLSSLLNYGEPIPRVGMSRDGRFAIAWQGATSVSNGIVMHVYGANGVASSPETMVVAVPFGYAALPQSAVAIDNSNSIALDWEQYFPATQTQNVQLRRYTIAGAPTTSVITPNSSRVAVHQYSAMAVNGDGDTVMVWDAVGQDGDGSSIYGQRLDRTGSFVGTEFRVNDLIPGNQTQPGIGITDEGHFVVTWKDVDTTTQAGEVFMKQFRSNGGAVGTGVVRVSSPGAIVSQRPAVSPDGKLSLYWAPTSTDTAKGVDVQKLRYTMDTQAATVLLASGTPVASVYAGTGTWKYFRIQVPAGATKLTVTLTGNATGNADLYVRLGAFPDITSYDARSIAAGNNESVVVNVPTPGVYYVGTYASTTFSAATLTATVQ
jgi:hypothetical protein